MDSQEPSTLVDLIGPRRKALRLTMQKAAEAAGVHRQTWVTWEKGTARPAEYNLTGLDAALQLPAGTVDAVIAGRPVTIPAPAPAPVADRAVPRPPSRARQQRARDRVVAMTREELNDIANILGTTLGEQRAEAFLERAYEIRAEAARKRTNHIDEQSIG